MHIYVRSVPQETTEAEQEFLLLMKAEIKSNKETEVPLLLSVLTVHHICRNVNP